MSERFSYEEQKKKVFRTVPVKEMIPGIRKSAVKGTLIDKDYAVSSDTPFIDILTGYDSLPQKEFEEEYQRLLKDEPHKLPEFLRKYRENYVRMHFKGQIVVDLGMGKTLSGYYLAALGGAKGYVGVEKYGLESSQVRAEFASLDPNKNLGQQIKKYLPTSMFYINESDNPDPIPASFEEGDMIDFLRRLPRNSVSIICSGIQVFDRAIKTHFDELMHPELVRVLSPGGILVFCGQTYDMPDLKDVVFDSELKAYTK